MIEIIARQDGKFPEKQQINGESVQISLNDWGHLAVRVIHPTTLTEDWLVNSDTLVVFDQRTTERIIEFIRNKVRRNTLTRVELKHVSINEDDLPF